MGRAIVREPQVFLMDEPLSNLDAKLRVQTRTQIAALQRRLGTTTVYVTHDQVEAMTMGDRVAVLKDGQAAAGRHAARPVRPAGQRVRRRLHRLAGDEPASTSTSTQDGAQLGGRTFPLPRETMAALAAEGAKTATLGFRPESVRVVGEGEGFPFEVVVVEELGSDAFAYGNAAHLGRRRPATSCSRSASTPAGRP